MFRNNTPPVLIAKAEEDSGVIQIVMIDNCLNKPRDQTNMLRLIGMQGVFYHELSKMPIPYITRLLFDPWVLIFHTFNHYSLTPWHSALQGPGPPQQFGPTLSYPGFPEHL